MADTDTNTKHAGEKLRAALIDLDKAVISLDETQKKTDAISGRIETVLRNTDASRKAESAARLKSLTARSRVLNKDLARAQRDYTAARRAFRTASKYNSALDRDQAQVLASVQTDLARSIQCNGAMVRSILSLIDRIDQGKTAEAGKLDGQAYSDRPGLHGYIPIDLSRFFNMLVELGRHLRVDSDYRHSRLPYRPVSFLEVGCGSGRNLLLTRASALLHLSEMAGFDINADQIEIGRSVFGLQDELSVDDAMQVDYGSYDVVYSFRPFHDTKMQSEYEAHLVASMRCSAYLIAPIAEDLSLFPDLACISPDHHIWKKLSGSGTGG